MLLSFGLDPEPEPHPALAAAQVPDTRTMLLAISVLGWLPEDRWEPAVRA